MNSYCKGMIDNINAILNQVSNFTEDQCKLFAKCFMAISNPDVQRIDLLKLEHQLSREFSKYHVIYLY